MSRRREGDGMDTTLRCLYKGEASVERMEATRCLGIVSVAYAMWILMAA